MYWELQKQVKGETESKFYLILRIRTVKNDSVPDKLEALPTIQTLCRTVPLLPVLKDFSVSIGPPQRLESL